MLADREWALCLTAGKSRALASLFLPLAFLSVGARAQGGPRFQLQPGIAIADFVSVPKGTTSTTAFSLRFVTEFPTSSRWLMPVIGAVLLPYGSTGNTNRNTDAPTLFAGNVFRLVSADQTSGWLSVDFPLLMTHSPGAGPTGVLRDYGRDLVALPTVRLHIGSRGLSELGRLWSRLEFFAQLEQNLTPNRDLTTGERDRLNPVATFGASLRLGSTSPGR